MKKRKQIREDLNLTQDEMAMLLNISRSQLSLYELGLRELSATGLVSESRSGRFLTMLEFSEPKQFPEISSVALGKDKLIVAAVRKNELNQYRCEKKIEKTTKNYNAALKLFQLTDFIIQSEDHENAIHLAALETLKAKALKVLNNGPVQLLKLELQQELLKHETVLLNKLLKGSREA